MGLNERICALFLRQFGLSTPQIEIVNDTALECALANTAKKTERGMEIHNRIALFMPCFEAATLKDIMGKTELGLNKADFKMLWHALGESIIFDLIIGNDDRLFKFKMNGDLPELEAAINAGNVMCALNRHDISEHSITTRINIKAIHLIDNSSNRYLLKLPKLEESDLDMGSMLCGNEDTAPEEDRKIEAETSIEDSVDADKADAQLKYIAQIKQFVVEFPGRKSDLVHRIAETLVHDWREALNETIDNFSRAALKKAFEEDPETAQEKASKKIEQKKLEVQAMLKEFLNIADIRAGLLEGIEQAVKKISEHDMESLIVAVSGLKDQDTENASVLDLFLENVRKLKEYKHDFPAIT